MLISDAMALMQRHHNTATIFFVFFIPGVCISVSLRIPRELKEDTFYQLLRDLSRNAKARAVVMFVNEDNIRELLKATIHYGMEGTFSWLASDSWGSKLYPIFQQESAAEGAVTILPLKQTLKGEREEAVCRSC